MYIVKKNIKGKDYFYIRKSEREGDKVISRNIAYGGKTREEAERKMKEITGVKKEEDKGEMKATSTPPKKTQDKTLKNIDDLASFCKRKGFVFKSSEIYGGFSGFWDFGPLGVDLFDNIKKSWWKFFVKDREDMAGIDASVISHPRTWKASGHLESFTDVFVECTKCKKPNKVDKFELEKASCIFCGGELDKKKVRDFNLMFNTQIGSEKDSIGYLRPETAQGMFMDFKLIAESGRKKLPFGIAQIGKCFRNEIAPRDFLFRSREFTIGEFEFFIFPDEKKCEKLGKKQLSVKVNLLDSETQEQGKEKLAESTIEDMLKKKKLDEWHAYWLAEQILWFKELGLDLKKIKIREHMKDELSHYSSATFDIDYDYPFGSKEVAGNANRGQFDLSQHEKESKEKLGVYDEATKKNVIPRVIEPTFGMERVFLAVLSDSYSYDEKRNNVVLKLKPELAPVKAAVFPIIKKQEYEKLALNIVKELREEFEINYDISGSVGRRYSRNDEIGTPYCITIDNKSPKNKDVTIRNRDDTKQIRVKIKDLKEVIRKLIREEIKFEEAGKAVETRKK